MEVPGFVELFKIKQEESISRGGSRSDSDLVRQKTYKQMNTTASLLKTQKKQVQSSLKNLPERVQEEEKESQGSFQDLINITLRVRETDQDQKELYQKNQNQELLERLEKLKRREERLQNLQNEINLETHLYHQQLDAILNNEKELKLEVDLLNLQTISLKEQIKNQEEEGKDEQ